MEFESFLKERHQLAAERIREVPAELKNGSPLPSGVADYFLRLSTWLIQAEELKEWMDHHRLEEKSLEAWQEWNRFCYRPIREDYHQSFANPEVAVRILGEDHGKALSFLAAEVYQSLPWFLMGHEESLVVLTELFLEIYTAFSYGAEEGELPQGEEIRQMIYWSMSDYCEDMVMWRIREQMDPEFSPLKEWIMTSDLSDLRYLYRWGSPISETEMETARYLNRLSQETIDQIAEAFVSGYFRGFEVMRISLAGKKYVTVRGSFGFERVFRKVVELFRERGLEPVFFPASTSSVNRRSVAIGYQGKSVNPQFEFDHSKDKALYYDRNFANRHLEGMKKAYEYCKEWIGANAGPACFETFGEQPFIPKISGTNWSLSKKQQKLEMEYGNLQMELMENYRKSSETSFTIIAFPIPDIGPDYPAIFEEILKVNTLDNDRYRRIQQILVDVLDRGEYVYVRGKAPNQTVMKVALHPLIDPAKETLFENCCADVNIPVGEVFTSPKLAGTEGLLHVTGVYLNGMYFRDLKLRFTDGQVTDYSCRNSGNLEDDRRLIKDYLLMGRETLPLGEFAVGTNTTAYAAARKYHIEERLPILIVEKMGPHFAIGDTCYSRAEEHAVYNPDGKEIIARENEISARRKDPKAEAYFNCHTDITIPYDEIDEILVVDKEENMIPIIRDGFFVLEGTESLNDPLNKG